MPTDLGGPVDVRTGAKGVLAAAAAGALLVGGAVAAVATTTASTSPTGLCLADGAPVTTAKTDASGAFTCPSGRTLLLVPAQEAVRALQAAVDSHDGRLRSVEDQTFGTGERLTQAEERLGTLEQRADESGQQLSSLEVRLDDVAGRVTALDDRLHDLEGRLSALDRRTAVSTVSAAATLGDAPQVVSCGTGRALSGSARTSGAEVVQSFPTTDGSGWSFVVRPNGDAPSATLLVVCAGATAAAPTAGPTAAPAPAEPAPAPGS